MMKKLVFPMTLLFLASCSTDNASSEVDGLDQAPTLLEASFQIAEHSGPGTPIGTVPVSNPQNKEITFGLESSTNLEIDPVSGEIRLGQNSVLDFENETETNVTVEIFDGTSVLERSYAITITNIDEYEVLTEEEQELIAYFNYLALWQGPFNTPLERNTKWSQPINIFMDGTISTAFTNNVTEILSTMNALFTSSDFTINLTEDSDLANTHLFYGTKEALAGKWADMYDLVKDQTFNGYALTNGSTASITGARIWVSNEAGVLFQHELGHSIGLGHSDRCDGQLSFMCSNITLESTLLEEEREVLRLLYHKDMSGGLTAMELQAHLSNILVLEN
jgi:hypothetical protein